VDHGFTCDAISVRATLIKPGASDIRFELDRISNTEFAVIEDGRNVGVFYRGLTYSGSYLAISESLSFPSRKSVYTKIAIKTYLERSCPVPNRQLLHRREPWKRQVNSLSH